MYLLYPHSCRIAHQCLHLFGSSRNRPTHKPLYGLHHFHRHHYQVRQWPRAVHHSIRTILYLHSPVGLPQQYPNPFDSMHFHPIQTISPRLICRWRRPIRTIYNPWLRGCHHQRGKQCNLHDLVFCCRFRHRKYPHPFWDHPDPFHSKMRIRPVELLGI